MPRVWCNERGARHTTWPLLRRGGTRRWRGRRYPGAVVQATLGPRHTPRRERVLADVEVLVARTRAIREKGKGTPRVQHPVAEIRPLARVFQGFFLLGPSRRGRARKRRVEDSHVRPGFERSFRANVVALDSIIGPAMSFAWKPVRPRQFAFSSIRSAWEVTSG